MLIIDRSFFVGEIAIPGIENTLDGVGAELDSFIEKYEPEFLFKILGEDLFHEFLIGLTDEPVEQKWIDLSDKLKNAFGSDLPGHCPIAKYVFWHYIRERSTRSTAIGNVIPNAENATPTTWWPKTVRVWNDMREDNYEIGRWLTTRQDIYGYVWHSSFCNHDIYTYKNRFDL